MSEKGYSSAQSGAVGKAKVPGQHSIREAGCVLSDSLQHGFLEEQSYSYLKAAGMGVNVSQVPKGTLTRLYELLQRQIHQEVTWVYPHPLELDPMRLQLQDSAQQDIVVSQLYPLRIRREGSEADPHRIRGRPRRKAETDATGQDHFAAFRGDSKASRRNA